jgi:hypothetical protein
MQTIFTYIVGTDNCDKRVARIISGWNSIDEGGICPDIEAFPVTEREIFNSFTLNLLGSADIDAPTRQSLCCILLLHFREVKETFPEHRLIRKMVSCLAAVQRTESDLLLWADNVKSMFELENGIFLPLDDIENGGSVRVRDMNEFMTKTVDQLHQNQLEIRELRSQVHDLQLEIHQIRNSEHGLHTKLDTIVSMLSTPSSAHNPIDFLEAQLPHMLQDAHNNSIESPTFDVSSNTNLMEHYFASTSGAPIVSPQPPIEEGTSMKSLSISAVFYDWFMNERYNEIPDPATRERFVFNEKWKMIAHLKRFLPNDFILRPKPATTSSSSSNQDLSNWTKSLSAISRHVQATTMNFLNDKVGAHNKRRRIEPSFSATYKRLMSIAPEEFPTPTNVSDLATPMIFQQEITEFRSAPKRSAAASSSSNSRRAAPSTSAGRDGLRKGNTQQRLRFTALLQDQLLP